VDWYDGQPDLTISFPNSLGADMRIPTEKELSLLVGEVVSGRSRPFDKVITIAIFGQDAPPTWGDWPKEAVAAWSLGCALYQDARKEQRLDLPKRTIITLEVSWDIVLSFAESPECWWRLPGVTWAGIGERIGMSPRRVAYRVTGLGWRFTGSGMSVPNRRVVAAPCLCCGDVYHPREMEGWYGPDCWKELLDAEPISD